MALVKREVNTIAYSPSSLSIRKRIEAGSRTPQLNYDWLKGLCLIQADSDESSHDAVHQYFMEHYHDMFNETKRRPLSSDRIQSLAKRPGKCSRCVLSASGNPLRGCQHANAQVLPSFNVQDYLRPIRGEKKTAESAFDVAMERAADISLLRKLMKRSSVERTRDDNSLLFKTLRKLDISALSLVQTGVLKELCTVAQFEVCDEANVEIDATNGFYLILCGSVRGLSRRVRETVAATDKECSLLPDISSSSVTLTVGDSFGTLGQSVHSNGASCVVSVCTVEQYSEFLLITAPDYERILQKIQRKCEQEKLDVIEGCKLFADWSKQPLNKIAKLVKWMKFPSGNVLAKEGELANFVAVIKTGECRVLRQIDAIVTLANDKKVVKKKEVEMCRIRKFDSFGESSLLFQLPMTYTVVTSSAVELAVLEPAALDELDATTLQLFKHSSEQLSRQISEVAMENEYMKQEEKRRWNKLKSRILSDALYYGGIQPGIGKWKK